MQASTALFYVEWPLTLIFASYTYPLLLSSRDGNRAPFGSAKHPLAVIIWRFLGERETFQGIKESTET